eukprot:m.358543 g.358543  ORF g.358543 m.358543 type:complete len:475 (-) comp18171_c0_seq1:162-1586(-)
MVDKCLREAQAKLLSETETAAINAILGDYDYDDLFQQFQAATSSDGGMDESQMKPVPSSHVGNATAFPPTSEAQSWFELGLDLIAQNKVAAILLAGGQGTRLGSPDPKGMFQLGLASGKTLFQLQAERIVKLQQLAQERSGSACTIPWYIMTSGPTFAKTKQYFEDNAYFGLDAQNVTFFQQFVIPSFFMDGKFILQTKQSIALNPDGNGGLYRALKERGVLADMEKRGIEHTHVYCVDNVLVKVCDPTFIGFCAAKNVPAGAVVVPKEDPHEKVGVVCRVNDKYQVVEYSEISKAKAEQVDEDGKLTFRAGNICNHYFSFPFLKMCGDRFPELVSHVAKKKIKFLDESGATQTPTDNNGIKLEKFVFDVFGFADNLGVLEVAREQSFSPLKNASGSCSKDTCQRDLYALHRLYLKNAGAKFVDADGQELALEALDASHVCEIDPAVSYAGEKLEEYVKKNGPNFQFPVIVKQE